MSQPPDGEYEVGYCKPPKGTQFKKGVSGNPKGRPKRPKDIMATFEKVLSEKITVRDSTGTRTMTTLEGRLFSSVQKAMQGESKAFSYIMQRAKKLGLIKAHTGHPDARGPRFMLVPDPMTPEAWEAETRVQQDQLMRDAAEDLRNAEAQDGQRKEV